MSARSARRKNARLGTGVLALALLAPAAEPAVAGATDPGEEQETQSEGTNDIEPGEGGEGAGELTPGQDSTGDIVDENSPPLVAPGDNSDPNEGENENGPVENEAQVPQPESEGEPPIQPPAPPATAPAPPPTPPAAQTTPAPAPAKPVPAPRSRVAPTRRAEKKPAPAAKTRPRARRPAPARTRATAPARPARAVETAPTQSVARATAAAPVAPVAPKAGGATYTVRAGDTLWSVAAARLGGAATPAQIAREVQRLWDVNARTIGTGDPSLLGVGVTLRLR